MRKFLYSPLWLARSLVGLAFHFVAAKFSRMGPSRAAPRESLLSSLQSAYEWYAHSLHYHKPTHLMLPLPRASFMICTPCRQCSKGKYPQ